MNAPKPISAQNRKQRARFFKRLLYRNYRAYAWFHHRYRGLPTPAGWVVLLATLIAAALGADPNSSLGYETFSLLGCLVLAAAICTPFGRPKISLRRALPRFGSVDQPLLYTIRVQNLGRSSQNSLSLIEELPDPRPSLDQFLNVPEPGEQRRNWIDRAYGYYRWRWLLNRNRRAAIGEIPLPDLPAGAPSTITARLTPLRRGVLRLPATTVACPDPFGIFRSLRKIPNPESVLILPRRHRMSGFQLPGLLKYQLGGVSMASSVGESEEFMSLREYRPGDPLRRIHWKSFAKLGKPIIKECQEEFFVRHALILDTFGAEPAGELFEEAVSIAASVACAIRDQESLLDLMFIGPQAYCFTSGRGVAHLEQMLEVLASVQMCTDTDFSALEHLVFSHAAELSGCVCVFLAWDEARQHLVKGLLARGVPLRVLVVSGPAGTPRLGVMEAQPENFIHLPLGQVASKLAAL